jgi:hypothetical protein
MNGATVFLHPKSPVTRDFGSPFGQDRLVPIFLATLAVRQQSQAIRFRSAAQMLEILGMRRARALEQLRQMKWSFPPDFKFNREEINER